MSLPQFGANIFATFTKWCQKTQKTNQPGGIIISNLNFDEQFATLKKENIFASKYADIEVSKYFVYNFSENVAFYLLKCREKDIHKAQEISSVDVKSLVIIYKDTFENTGVRIASVIITDIQTENTSLNCDFCKDLFLVPIQSVTDVNEFSKWYNHLPNKLSTDWEPLIDQSSESERVDKYKVFCERMLGLVASKNSPHLPNFAVIASEQIEQLKILLNPKQLNFLNCQQKCILLRGNHGTGKSLVLQEKIKLLKRKNKRVVYVNFDKTSNCHLPLDENKICVVIQNTEGDNLSSILESISKDMNKLEEHVHILVDEYDGEYLTKKEAIKVKNIIKDKLKGSTIVIAPQCIQKKRTDIDGELKIEQDANKFDILTKDLFYEIELQDVMRNTVEINEFAEFVENFLRKSETEFAYPMASSVDPKSLKNQTASTRIEAETTSKIKHAKTDARQESKGEVQEDLNEHFKAETKPDTKVELKGETELQNQGETKNEARNNSFKNTFLNKIEDFDVACKYLNDSENIVNKNQKIKTVTTYHISAESRIGHSIKAGVPLFFHPFISKDANENIVSIAAVLDALLNDYKQLLIVHFEDETPDLIIYALKVLEKDYTEDLMEFREKKVNILLTKFFQIRGMEFPNILIVIDPEEYHLKHIFLESITRCTCNLSLMPLKKIEAPTGQHNIKNILKSIFFRKNNSSDEYKKYLKDLIKEAEKNEKIREIVIEKCNANCKNFKCFYCHEKEKCQKKDVTVKIAINERSAKYKYMMQEIKSITEKEKNTSPDDTRFVIFFQQ